MGLIPQLTDEVQLIVQDNHSDQPVESLFSNDVKAKCTFCVISITLVLMPT